MGRMLIAIAALAVPLWSASAYCSRPIAPYCAIQYGQFPGQYDFERCRSDMEVYRGEIETYRSCLQREQEEALREFYDAVERFKRRGRG